MGDPFDHVTPDDKQRLHIMTIREAFKRCLYTIEVNVPAGRERSVAITNLEQAAMWAIKAIAHAEVKTDG